MPAAFWLVLAFAFGAVVGSFLNVVIWRMPRGESLSHPGSHCPQCNRPLRPYENIPLASYLALRGRCRTCGARIAPRYFWVELLTAAVFTAICARFGPTLETIAYSLFAAALIAALFIDLEHYIIPDELNTFALMVAVGLDLARMATGDPAHAPVWGWLPRSLLGAVVCAGIFVAIQMLGLLAFRKEAMGDGDVKLARAIGAMLPLSQALVSFFLAVAVGAVLGTLMIMARSRSGAAASAAAADQAEQPLDEEPLAVSDVLMRSAIYTTFADLGLQLGRFLRIPPLERVANKLDPPGSLAEEDDFVAGPTHVPFGPFLVIGALLAVFVGDRLVAWYLRWSNLA